MAKKEPPRNPVLDEHLAQFTACVAFWADVLGLSDWRINVSDRRSTRKSVMAEVYKIDLEQRSATIRIGTDFGGTAVTERSLSEAALHECLHIFLREFKETCQSEVATEDDVFSAEHRIINILERLLSLASPLGPKA